MKNVVLNSTFKKLDHGIQSHHFMAKTGKNMEAVTDFIFFTADGDCSHEIKRHLLLGRKAMTNIDKSIKKHRHHFANMVHTVKAMVFPILMYRCESWTTKKAERWRIDAFELWGWERLWKVLWTARRSNQTILKEINPEYSLEGLMLKLKLQYSGHLMQKANSLEKTLMLGKIKGRRRREWRGWDGWMASPTQWRWVLASSGRWQRTGKPGVLQSMGLQRTGHNLGPEQQQFLLSNLPFSILYKVKYLM